jgi:hypothetical protein
MDKSTLVRADTLKLGDLVRVGPPNNVIGAVLRRSSHVNGAAVLILSPFMNKGGIIDLPPSDLASVLDADFFEGDKCICRTYQDEELPDLIALCTDCHNHPRQATTPLCKACEENRQLRVMKATNPNGILCIKNCGRFARKNSNYCQECWG